MLDLLHDPGAFHEDANAFWLHVLEADHLQCVEGLTQLDPVLKQIQHCAGWTVAGRPRWTCCMTLGPSMRTPMHYGFMF